MYPNPQDALPLPARPNIEQYKKLAKDLVRACQSDDASAIRVWANRWMESLAGLVDADAVRDTSEVIGRAEDIEQFARKKLRGGAAASGECALTAGQFVIARAHGFMSWPKLVHHIESLALEDSTISAFERAALAVVRGDRPMLDRLLREHPNLIRERSTREHRATLLHYVSANGVEGYRQVSPKNSAEIASVLLDAGAEVDAEADVYGGKCTPLGLVATSGPLSAAGVQREVIDILLDHGAKMDRPGTAGNQHRLVHACLANGQPAAAAQLVSRGAALDFREAAGLGRVDVLKEFVTEDGRVVPSVATGELKDAFALAGAYGRADAVRFLLAHGMSVDTELRGHGEGHTALHVAAYHAHREVVSILLGHGASVDAVDKTWGTKPLVWALTGWSRKAAPKERYYDVVTALVAAGAPVTEDMLDWTEAKTDPRMLAALARR